MPSVKCQKRSQAIILIPRLHLSSPSFPGGKLNQPSVHFTSIGLTSHSCKTPCTPLLLFFFFLKGRFITIWQIEFQHSFEKLFKTQSLRCFAHTLPTIWIFLRFWMDIPVLFGILWIIVGFFQSSSES